MNNFFSIELITYILCGILFGIAYHIGHYAEATLIAIMILFYNRYLNSAKFREKVDPYF